MLARGTTTSPTPFISVLCIFRIELEIEPMMRGGEEEQNRDNTVVLVDCLWWTIENWISLLFGKRQSSHKGNVVWDKVTVVMVLWNASRWWRCRPEIDPTKRCFFAYEMNWMNEHSNAQKLKSHWKDNKINEWEIARHTRFVQGGLVWLAWVLLRNIRHFTSFILTRCRGAMVVVLARNVAWRLNWFYDAQHVKLRNIHQILIILQYYCVQGEVDTMQQHVNCPRE